MANIDVYIVTRRVFDGVKDVYNPDDFFGLVTDDKLNEAITSLWDERGSYTFPEWYRMVDAAYNDREYESSSIDSRFDLRKLIFKHCK